jgi:hypothetical protein
MELIGCPETSVRNCNIALRNIPEERRSYGSETVFIAAPVVALILDVCMDKVVTYTFSPVHYLETVRSLNRNRMERPAYYALQILFKTFCRCGAHVTMLEM